MNEREYISWLNIKADYILWHEWDPIGVRDLGVRDEYRMYVSEVVSMLLTNVSIEVIARHLYDIETKRMGLSGSLTNCRKVASILDLTKGLYLISH